MSENNSNTIIDKEFENIINNKEEKKILKPLKKLVGFFNLIILINFFILQFSNIFYYNYYFQLLLNELICIYLWIEKREIKFKYHFQKIKLILYFILLFDIISFIYYFKFYSKNKNKYYYDYIMFLNIYLSDILFHILCLSFIFTINKFFNNNNI